MIQQYIEGRGMWPEINIVPEEVTGPCPITQQHPSIESNRREQFQGSYVQRSPPHPEARRMERGKYA